MVPLWGFVAVTVPLVLTPGVSTAIVLRDSIAGGVRAGLVTAVGINTGSFCYGLLTAFGFALALQRWPAAWVGLRVVGVLYLAWLGTQSLRRAFFRPMARQLPSRVAGPQSIWRNLYEGFVTNPPHLRGHLAHCLGDGTRNARANARRGTPASVPGRCDGRRPAGARDQDRLAMKRQKTIDVAHQRRTEKVRVTFFGMVLSHG